MLLDKRLGLICSVSILKKRVFVVDNSWISLIRLYTQVAIVFPLNLHRNMRCEMLALIARSYFLSYRFKN
jgi:hypothetical protein